MVINITHFIKAIADLCFIVPNMKKIVLFFPFLLVALLAMQTVNFKLSTAEFQQKLESVKHAQVVDVRTPDEFKKNHLKGAMNLNVNGTEFQNQVAALDKSKTVLVYCWSGARSARAADYMRSVGLTVFEMKDGMMRWLAEDRPVEASVAPSAGMSMEEFNAKINAKKIVLVDFNAPWCAPCKKMSPWLDELATAYADKIDVVKINSEQHATVMKSLNVAAVPTLMLYHHGKVVWQHTGGDITKAQVEEQIKKLH